MIIFSKFTPDGRLATAKLGHGTIAITAKPTISNKVYIDIQACPKSKIGEDLPVATKVDSSLIMRLAFSNVESIDALIVKLQDAKSYMLEHSENRFWI